MKAILTPGENNHQGNAKTVRGIHTTHAIHNIHSIHIIHNIHNATADSRGVISGKEFRTMAKFETGRLLQTRGIAASIEEAPELLNEIINAFNNYICGNWGQLCEEDKQANEEAIENGGRILARYKTSQGDIYIITEADRSVTTILFCDEY